MDSAIIQIKRGTDILIEGFIEDVKLGGDYVQYTGRSFLVLMGYSTASKTISSGGNGRTEAEYSNEKGDYIIEELISRYCTTKDSEVTSSVSFTDIHGDDVVYKGDVKLHGKKVYQIVREMCQSYGHDLWSSTTWVDDDVTVKTINVGEKTRGHAGTVTDPGDPHTTLRGGVHLKGIPIVTYRSSETINCLRVIGGGTGKDKVSVFVEDAASIAAIGYVEGETYHSNMIKSIETAESVGEAIIDAKKDPVEEIDVETALYINDLEYGDWVRIVDTYTNLDTTKRIKSITRVYNINSVDSMILELGDKFDNYQNIINDLTKGDVDPEPDMVMAGGSLRVTANDPPDTYVRIDGGDWYGSDGVLYRIGNMILTFWENDGNPPPYNAKVVGNYFKALIQIKDNATVASDITYKTSLTSGAETGSSDDNARSDIISPDTGYMPVCELILKCCDISGTVCDITALNEDDTKSYIYRDARPIVGSTAGLSGACWEKNADSTASLKSDVTEIDMEGKAITSTGGTNLIFEVGTGNSFIFRKV
jgi:hypothetical protein